MSLTEDESKRVDEIERNIVRVLGNQCFYTSKWEFPIADLKWLCQRLRETGVVFKHPDPVLVEVSCAESSQATGQEPV